MRREAVSVKALMPSSYEYGKYLDRRDMLKAISEVLLIFPLINLHL